MNEMGDQPIPTVNHRNTLVGLDSYHLSPFREVMTLYARWNPGVGRGLRQPKAALSPTEILSKCTFLSFFFLLKNATFITNTFVAAVMT